MAEARAANWLAREGSAIMPVSNLVNGRRLAFLHKERLRCPAVATSLEEVGGRLFAFLDLPQEPMEIGANDELH